ncbi:hypothetical protein EVAR_22858_1 [Eumeta japonica]|uniref:Uncharacterized protein n=1 Tax=Eumeta variegata TaxID=151549 RepID=A0A4C1UUQ2_EUMVA|nr:hypothetical protein EVAR_22858_1 [Eumeta japonica]
MEKVIETDGNTESNQLLSKKLKSNVTKQSDTSCDSKVTTTKKDMPSFDMLEQMYKNNNSDVIPFCANGFDDLKQSDEKPKSPDSLNEPVVKDKIVKSSLISLDPINLEQMELQDYVLENVETTSTQKYGNNLRNSHQNMKKPLPSLIDLENLFESNGTNDKCNNHKIKTVKRFSLKIKEKDKITKSKQLIAKKRRNIKNKQTNKTSGVISGNIHKPLPSFAELEQMFEDNINDDFKSFHINDAKNVFKSPKSLRALANTAIKFYTSAEKHEFAKSEPFKSSDTSENMCPSSSKYWSSNEIKQIYHTDSKDDHPFSELESKGNSKIFNISEIGVDGTENYNEDSFQFSVHHAKYSSPKDDSVFDEKGRINKHPEITNNMNLDTRSDVSNESSKTILYDYNALSPTNNKFRTFSPIPSTSSDNETFLKNDIRFNESLLQNDTQDEVEVIEIPCETIILDDDADNDNSPITQPIVNVNELPTSSSNNVINNYYDTINVDESFDDDCEIVDVDVVINENNAILEKYRKNEIEKNNSHIPSGLLTINSETETRNDFTQKDNSSHTSCKDKIADVVKNFFSNQSQSSNSISASTNVDKSSIKKYDCLIKLTQSLLTPFTGHPSQTQVTQVRNSVEDNTSSNMNVIEALDESMNQNYICDDSVIIVSSTVPQRQEHVAFNSHRNINNIHSRNRLTNLDNVYQTNRHISNDKRNIPKTKAVPNKYNSTPANKNSPVCTAEAPAPASDGAYTPTGLRFAELKDECIASL